MASLERRNKNLYRLRWIENGERRQKTFNADSHRDALERKQQKEEELLRMKSMGGLLEKFDSYGWEHLDYQGTFFDGVEYYDGFKLHNKPLVEVKDKLTGETRMLELFGSVVELDNGTLKILSIPG